MKRTWIYLIGAVLVIAAAVGVFIAIDNSNDHSGKATNSNTEQASSSQAFKPRQACKVFTLADAKQLLGASAKGSEVTSNTSSDDLEVSTCNYTQDSGSNSPITAAKSASILVRAPKTGAGITSNENQFGPLKPADSEHVAGYGDNAYWDSQYGQLDILKNNTWYILSYGPITPADRTLDQAKQLADMLIDKM